MGNKTSQVDDCIKYRAINDKEVKEKLDKYGVCYIPNVISDEEKISMINGTWNFFEYLTQKDEIPIKQNDNSTWKELTSCMPINDMIYHHWNAGHSQHVWDIRQNYNVANIFADLFDCKLTDLLVSFDGFAFLPPPEITDIGWYTQNSEWFHLDQSLYRPNFDGVQGFVTAYDINKDDATFTFFEGSNKYIQDFVDAFGYISETDWVPFSHQHVKFFKNRCLEKQLICPAKSLVIWDSRTLHCAIKPKKTRKKDNTRCITYVSYSHKSKISKDDLEEKIYAYENMLTSNHYAHKPHYFDTLPPGHNVITDYVVPISKPTLTPLGLSLTGYDMYEDYKML